MKIDAIWIILLALLMMPIIILMIDIPRTIMIILLIILTPILIINTLMLLSGRVRISVINILIWFWVVLRHPGISKKMMIMMIKKRWLMSQMKIILIKMRVRKILLMIIFLPTIIHANIKTISQMIKIIMIRINVHPAIAERMGLIVEVIMIIMIILLMIIIIQNIILPAIS